MFEEDFDDPDSLAGSGGVPDPLLAELGRARTGQMRDIVATIQAEQDAIIRAPLETCLVVQGGPGTGKTAVGLHRAAFLLYEHRARLARGGVLVVGPNPVFLRYISQVLPSLGETSATQTTVDGLLALRFRVVADDSDAAAAVKGDARMADGDRTRPRPTRSGSRADGIVLTCRARPIRVERGRARGDGRRPCAPRDVPITAQRERFRHALVHHAYDALHARRPARLRRAGARRRAARRPGVAQGDRRMLALGRRGRARAVAADPARARWRARPTACSTPTSSSCCSGRAPRPTRGRRTICRCSTRPRRC